MSINDSDLPTFGRNLMVEGYSKEPKDHTRSKSVFTSPPSRPKIYINSNSKLDRSIEGSPRRSPASVEYQSVSKNYDTVKKYVAQINFIDTQLNFLLGELRKKLGVRENDIAMDIKVILQRVDELLEAERQLKDKEKEVIQPEPVESQLENLHESFGDDATMRSLNQQIEENLKEIASLRTLNEALRSQAKANEDVVVKSLRIQMEEKVREIESLKASNDELRDLIKASNDVPLTKRIEQEDLLKDSAYIFQKASLASLMRGLKLKQEEMASVEKVQIDYKQKRVIVEYNITEGDFAGTKDIVKGDYEMRYNCAAKVLLKSATKLARKFITTNNFLLCNITDLCRFAKGKSASSAILGKICKDLEVREHEFNEVRVRQKEQEKSLIREVNVLEPLEELDTFMNSLMNWCDHNYSSLKDVYQQLFKDVAQAVSAQKTK